MGEEFIMGFPLSIAIKSLKEGTWLLCPGFGNFNRSIITSLLGRNPLNCKECEYLSSFYWIL